MNETLYVYIKELCAHLEKSLKIISQEIKKDQPDLNVLINHMKDIKKLPEEVDEGILLLKYLKKRLKKKSTQSLFNKINDLYKLE